jgi:hypothetical protein
LDIIVANNGLGLLLGIGLHQPDNTHTYPMEFRRRGNPLYYTPVVGKSLDAYVNVSIIGTPIAIIGMLLAELLAGPSRPDD